MMTGINIMRAKVSSMHSRLVLLVIAAMGFVVSTVSATYTTQYSSVTMYGACGARVCLGFPPEYVYFYNYIALGFLFLIATSASERNSSFFALLLPLFAAMFAWFRWLILPSASQVGGTIVCCAILAVAVYMKGKQQEKFGIAGPGSPFLNIVFWMIVLQASMGFINAMGLFDFNVANTPSQYQNVDLSSTVPNTMGAGGLWQSITSDAYLLGSMMVSGLMMMLSALTAIIYFKGLVLSIAPFIANEPVVDLMLNVITVGIDFVIVVAMWMWYFKPPLGESV
jgi:hypothetical protein